METLFKKQFSGLIRSLKTSEDNRLLCVEQIGKTGSSPQYHILDLNSSTLLNQELSVKKSNALVLKAITGSFLILNEYSDGQNPDKATAIAFDYKSKTIKWQKENFQVLDVSNNMLKSPHQYFENRFSYWDIKTGLIVESEEQLEIETNNTQEFPLFYSETSEHFNWFVKFIIEKNGHRPILCCEYLEMGGVMVISYYFQQNNGLTNNLLILDNSGMIIETIKLGENLQGIGKDTFFALANQLIFISNKNTLNIYEV